MYLSKISFLPSRVKNMVKALRDGIYSEHRMIWNVFENQQDQTRDFLYRRQDQPGTFPFFYLLSQRKPNSYHEDLEIETKEFNPVIRSGDRFAFSLRANAVVSRKKPEGGKQRVRRDIIEAKVDEYKARFQNPDERPSPVAIHHEAAQQWIGRQAESNGFSCESVFVENHQYHKARKPGDPNIRQFTSLDFNGQIQVNDPEAFSAVLMAGLGRSKAFGCGLMLVRRL